MIKFIFFLSLTLTPLFAQDILPIRDRAYLIDQIQKERIKKLLPKLMEEQDIDVWVMITREYNEDPVIKTMLPATWQSARRTTMLVIYNPGAGKPLETMAMARDGVGELVKKVWEKEQQPDQWKALAELIAEKNPKKIGVNKCFLVNYVHMVMIDI